MFACGPMFFSSGQFKTAITVPAASVSSALTSFPLFVNLANMPAAFWTHLGFRDGRDIRVKDASGNDLPFDLVNIRPIEKAGSLFVKLSLSNVAATTFYIHYGNRTLDFVPVAAANGRNAVWSDYERVFTLGDNSADRTGKGSYPSPIGTGLTLTGYGLANTATSANLSAHQGVAWDGTYYYVADTNQLKKYDASFNLITTNNNPCGDVGNGVNHCGDPEVFNGMLYVPIENYTNISTWSAQRIARFRASDLTFIDSVSVSAQGHEVATIAYNPRDGYMYVASYANGAAFRKYDANTLAYVGSLTLSESITQIQGLTFWREAWWVNRDDTDDTQRVDLDGSVRNRVWGLGGGTVGSYEGLSHNDDSLLAFHDTDGNGNGKVLTFSQRIIAAQSGSRFFGAGALVSGSVTRNTQWTMGASAYVDSKTANHGILSYGTAGSTDSTQRTSLAYRSSSDRFGIWNSIDGWVLDTLSPVAGTTYRLNVTHNGTTARKFYRNGANTASSSAAITAMPPASANALFVGTGDASTAEVMDGGIGYAYLRFGILSDAWLAAEYSNLNAPGSFYSVGSEQVA